MLVNFTNNVLNKLTSLNLKNNNKLSRFEKNSLNNLVDIDFDDNYLS